MQIIELCRAYNEISIITCSSVDMYDAKKVNEYCIPNFIVIKLTEHSLLKRLQVDL